MRQSARQQARQLIGLVWAVIHAVQQHVLEADAAASLLGVLTGGRHQLLQREAVVDRHKGVA